MNSQSKLISELRSVIEEFESLDSHKDIRERVLTLLPAFESLRKLGKSIIPNGLKLSARERLLEYFRLYPLIILNERELALIAGISEWARRVRELRVQFGWKIISGLTAIEMSGENDFNDEEINALKMGPNDYMLIDIEQDRDSAYRWNIANEIRKTKTSMKDKLLEFLRRNVSKPVTGEELRYVAQGTEWARRIRELRTEDGWPITTKQSGNPTLPIGVYVLEMDRQTPNHDRRIPDPIRREALRRDNYKCRRCGWSYEIWNPSDPRFLELHHILHHVKGGGYEMENLITYCNICHDDVHRLDKTG
jgi:hypothetical protein